MSYLSVESSLPEVWDQRELPDSGASLAADLQTGEQLRNVGLGNRKSWRRQLLIVTSGIAAVGACTVLASSSTSSRGHPTRFGGGGSGEFSGLDLQPQVPLSTDEFLDLGPGACINQKGQHLQSLTLTYPSKPRKDGSSAQCEKICRMFPTCTGYESGVQDCTVLNYAGYRPSSARGNPKTSRCFWRHSFKMNTSGLYEGQQPPIPKIIWSFWQNMPGPNGTVPYPSLPEFVDACIETMRSLNPDWEVRVVNETSVKKWLSDEDMMHLTARSSSMSIQHRSDVYRLALLAKYGGVWADASTLMTNSLNQIMGDNPNRRTFFGLPNIVWGDPSLIANDTRIDWKYHSVNWFLAAPKNDTFVHRLRDCVWQFMMNINRKHLGVSGMFTPLQLEMMNRVGIRAYLSTDACAFKVIDEDWAMRKWYQNSQVLSPVSRLGWGFMADLAGFREKLFDRYDDAFAHQLIDDPKLWMKFTGDMRKAMVLPVTPADIWCHKNTFRQVLLHSGVKLELIDQRCRALR
eukprot:TRINITY_DN78989_c0_g1_i1.p1 TRINITY_DN78989_c0_g1~~TRINITY_DN78989_c0_g1_i1.p1  ORF type:complete len:525 (+),score=72.32 TRINITY_DN78989_c0_g1_i1:25-1575(+)